MKKLTIALGIAALATMSLTSCGKSSAASAEDKAFADSLTIAWGQLAGAQAHQSVLSNPMANIDTDEFVRGVNAAMQCDSTQESYMQGLMMGLRLAQQRIYAAKQLGVEVDTDLWMKSFREALKNDTLNPQIVGREFQRLAQEAEQRAAARREAELANSPEAVANVAAAAAYTDSIKAADPAVIASESGLVYKIENPGEGDAVKADDRVYVIYTGRLLDGTVFDSSKGEPVAFSPKGVVPGFSEGLQLLGKGGKATLYIPGELAYGVNGQPQAGIGPNQMLVFDVEIVSINEAPATK